MALQSWALWVARGLGLPFTGYAVDGAAAPDVVGEQIPAFLGGGAHPDVRYDLGCLYIGVNDVRAVDWDARAFAQSFARALAFLGERCDRVLTVTAPLDLGRPRAGAKVRELNATIEAVAGEQGALVLDLSGFGAPQPGDGRPRAPDRVRSDRDRRAGARRARARRDAGPRPARRRWSATRRRGGSGCAGTATYAYRHLKVSARAAARAGLVAAPRRALAVLRPEVLAQDLAVLLVARPEHEQLEPLGRPRTPGPRPARPGSHPSAAPR